MSFIHMRNNNQAQSRLQSSRCSQGVEETYIVFAYDDLDSCIVSILLFIINNKITSFLKEKRQKGFFGNGPC